MLNLLLADISFYSSLQIRCSDYKCSCVVGKTYFPKKATLIHFNFQFKKLNIHN